MFHDGKRRGVVPRRSRVRRKPASAGSKARRNHSLRFEPLEPRALLAADVVVSEIMYQAFADAGQPEDYREEFIELYNRGDAPADLLGWKFTDGVDFEFPDVTIGAGQYLVVTADPAVFAATHPGVTNYISQHGWDGHLSNSGEEIRLEDNLGATADRVTYADEGEWSFREKVEDLDFPSGQLGLMEGYAWSNLHDGGGRSLELINPALTNNAGQNWAASLVDGGTPGAVNTVASADVAPLIRDVAHYPIIPTASEKVTVTAKIQDELTAGRSVELYYRDDGDPSFNTATMFDDGLHGDGNPGDGIYAGEIPARPDGTIVEFYIEGTDAGANTRTWPLPVAGIDQTFGEEPRGANALYQVDDNFTEDWTPGDQPIFRLIMPADDWDYLDDWSDVSSRSFKPDGRMNATFIATDGVSTKLRYNIGVRNRGNGSRSHNPHNLRLNVPSDRPWQGYTAMNLNAQRPYSQILGSAIFRYADVPAADGTRVQVLTNGVDRADAGSDMFGSYLWIETLDGEMVANHWPDDAAGNFYKANYYLPGGRTEATLEYLGEDPDLYRNEYGKQTNVAVDDYTDLIQMLDVLNNAPDETYFADVSEVINVEQWVRFMGVDTLLSNREGGLITGAGDDYGLYAGMLDLRFTLVPYDLDSIATFGGGSTSRSIWTYRDTDLPGLYRLLNQPEVAQLYYQQLLDLADNVFAPEIINPLIDQVLGGWRSQATLDGLKSWFADRVANVRSQIPQDALSVQRSLSVVGGYPRSTDNTVVLSGKANGA